MPPSRFHRPELDVLRFGAFFLVFLHHALPHASGEYPAWGAVAQALAAVARAGALGVDLFFALSSYLITELLLREHRTTGTLNIRAFYGRRVLRIWPLYYFALFVLVPAMPGETLPTNYLAGFALLSGNWVCAFSGYPASSFSLLWSVSIEEQFYLAWPWLVRGNVRRIGAIAVAMLAVASVTRVWLAATGTVHPGVWCNTLARLDPIAGGALLAVWGGAPKPRLSLVCAGLCGLLIVGGFADHSGWITVLTYPAAAACAVAILSGVIGWSVWSRRFRLLAYLGRISFGLYVFHAAAIELAGPVLALPLTIALATASYKYLETPFLRLKERFGARVVEDSIQPLQ
jgi:peptidoglycan/LPS O-acetylase OafA/YrhL